MKRTKTILTALIAMALLPGGVVSASAVRQVSISELNANPPER